MDSYGTQQHATRRSSADTTCLPSPLRVRGCAEHKAVQKLKDAALGMVIHQWVEFVDVRQTLEGKSPSSKHRTRTASGSDSGLVVVVLLVLPVSCLHWCSPSHVYTGAPRLMFTIVRKDKITLDPAFVYANQQRFDEYSVFRTSSVSKYVGLILHDAAGASDQMSVSNLIVYTIKQSSTSMTTGSEGFIKEFAISLSTPVEMQKIQ